MRKALGGGMRQAGVLAAAGLLAVQEGPALLAVDHQRAKALATGLEELAWPSSSTGSASAGSLSAGQVPVDVAATESNIVMLQLGEDSVAPLLSALELQGVRASGAGGGRIRFVLHRDLDDDSGPRCLAACREFLGT